MKRLLMMMASTFVLGAYAKICHWTGSVSGDWSNPANWQEGTVPGRYIDGFNNATGELGDTAVFGDTLVGNGVTSIDFSKMISVKVLKTEGTTQFTYGTSEEQFVSIEPKGTFSAAETCETPAANVQAKLRIGVDIAGGYNDNEKVTVRNNSLRELYVASWGHTTLATGDANTFLAVLFTGSGDIRIGRHTMGKAYKLFRIGMTGKLTIDDVNYFREFKSVAGENGEMTPVQVVVSEGGTIQPVMTMDDYFCPQRDIVISGDGIFEFPCGATQVSHVKAEYASEFACRVKSVCLDGTMPAGRSLMTISAGNKPMVMSGINEMRGIIEAGTGVKLTADAFGLRGTYGRFGDTDYIMYYGGTLRYTGTGETTDRNLTLKMSSDGNAGSVKGRLDQCGTGVWTVNSSVTIDTNITSGNFELIATSSAPAIFSGTMDSHIIVTKLGQGEWTFAPQNNFTGTIKCEDGILKLGKSMNLAKVEATAGSTKIFVPDGYAIVIDNLIASNGKVDFVLLGTEASVKVNNLTAGSGKLTVNGCPYILNENDKTLSANTDGRNVWAFATSGAWNDVSKWMNGSLDVTRNTYIEAVGDDYEVSIDGDTVTMTNLFMSNFGTGKATLGLKNGANLTVQGVSKNGPFLTMKKGAKIDIDSATFTVKDFGNGGGGQSGNWYTAFENAEIITHGTGVFNCYGFKNGNSYLQFRTGELTFNDSSVFKIQNVSSTASLYVDLEPLNTGDTINLSFKDNSYFNFGWIPYIFRLTGNGGNSIVDVNTGYSHAMTLGKRVRIGQGNGIGELRITRGTVQTDYSDYLWVATAGKEAATSDTLFTTGRVVIAEGGKLWVHGTGSGNSLFHGVQIGHGTVLKGARGTSHLYGEMQVAGDFEQLDGMFLLGSGVDAVGNINQTGGRLRVIRLNLTSSLSAPGAVGIGVFGGIGNYAMTGGLFETQYNVFIGGASITNLNYSTHVNSAKLNTYHDAKGTVSVSGGSFTAKGNIYLGRDGTGILELSGEGSVKATTISVANTDNCPQSGLRFVSDEEGRCGVIDSETALEFASDTKVTVDVTKLVNDGKLRRRRMSVWNLTNAPVGLTEGMIELLGADGLHKPNRIELSSSGKVLTWKVTDGTVISLR